MDIDRAALMQVFLSDSEEDLARIEEGLLALEDRPDELKTVDAIFRSAHTLKGNASILSLDTFSRTAHALEDVLDAVRKQRTAVTADLTTLLLAGVDALRTMLASLHAGEPEDPARHADVMSRLAAAVAEAKDKSKDAAKDKDKDKAAHAAPAPAHAPAPAPAAEAVPQPGPAEESAPLPFTLEGRFGPALRIETTRIDRLMDLTARVSVAQAQIGARLLVGGEVGSELRELHQKSDRLLMELQDWVMEARMVPVSSFFRSYIRTVRDAARSQRKRVRLQIEGERVRVDTGIGDGARDVLTHLIRNAIDHGIEPPGVRASHGKNPEGTIVLRAAQTGNQVVIQVSDDGAGFNLSRIRARARAMGRPNADTMPAEALYRLVFEPGFSTAERVTEMSGRGVGMDVVLRNVEALHGTVDIESTEGAGSTIELRLPLTLSVIEGFWIDVAGTEYVLPLDDVVECLEVPPDQRDMVDAEGIIDVRGEPLIYLQLRELFGVAEAPRPIEQIVVVRHKQSRIGLAVDAIRGQRQTVIKPLGRLFRMVPGISGSTMRPDGGVALVIDVSRLVRSPNRSRPH
jgi:two-component system chemotaxis sensor kinase CheA